jgi:hypothetical protein
MKTPLKTKKTTKQKSNTHKKIGHVSIKLVHSKKPILKHLRLVSHQHTGKLIQIQHTSHLALLGMLVIVGFFLVISQNFVGAANNVQVGVVVKGPPPKAGATITSPIDRFNIVNINPSISLGTCVAGTFVVAYNDGILGGSTICGSNGTFSINVQLHEGNNALTARNFDNLNQAGPTTPTVKVTFTSHPVTTDTTTPILPENPVIIPGVTPGPSDCADYRPTGTLSVGGQPHVAVVCVPRSIVADQEHSIGVLVWGGTPPYALSFAWGSGDSTLISVPTPGYNIVQVHYASSGIYNINVQVTDGSSRSTSGQSAIQVTDAATAPQTLTQAINNIFTASWFQTPVPLYVIAVGLTLGFWGGDIFNRRFGAKRLNKRSKRA